MREQKPTPPKTPAKKKRGRPPIPAAKLDAAAAEALELGADQGEVAAKHGVTVRSLQRRIAALAKNPAAKSTAAPAKAPSERNGGYSRDFEEAWALDDRILGARNPAAGVELSEGRLVFASGDAAAFEAWLVRPFPDDAFEGDTLDATRHLLGKLVGRFERSGSGREAGALAEKINATIGRIEQILAKRPAPPRPDAVLEELKRLDLDAIARIEEHLPNPITPAEVA